MGTRSLTKVIQTYTCRDEEGKGHKKEFVLMNMYRQMDGYPEGHGKELADFLKDIHITNGMQGGETRQIANGARCLAAQMVTHLKEGPGGIYLYPVRANDCCQEYEYIIRVDEDKLSMQMEIYDAGDKRKKLIFRGSPTELLEIDFTRQREELARIRQRKRQSKGLER